MYLDLSYDRTGHEHFAAYQTADESIQILRDSSATAMANQLKQIENNYNLGKSQISASISNAKTSAAASVKSAQIGANATIKATKIRAEVDRYGIDTNAAVEREKIAQAREEMFKVGIPSMLIDAWTAEKNYEVAKQTLGMNIAQTAAQLRSTPDKYFMAADFESVLPYMLNSASGQAGGGLNGAVGADGTPDPNALEGVVQALMSGAATTGTGTGGLFDQIKQLALGSGATGSGTGSIPPNPYAATAGTSGQQNGKGWIDALTSMGKQAIGGLDLNHYQVGQGDVDAWFASLRDDTTDPPSPTDDWVAKAAEAARANGYNTSVYDQWLASRQPAPAPAAAPAPVAAPTPPQPTDLNPQDMTMLASVGAMMQNGGLDPLLLDKMNPTQTGMLQGALARLKFDPTTEFWKAQQKRPGQGDPLAA